MAQETPAEVKANREVENKAGGKAAEVLPEKFLEYIANHKPAATDSKGVKHELPPSVWSDHELDAFFKWSEHDFDKFSRYMGDLLRTSELYELELSRRSVLGNPYKLMTAGSGIAMLADGAPVLGGLSIAGVAGLQAYDDFKNLRDQKSALGIGKYGLGLVADTAIGVGGLGFVLDEVPMEFKATLLIGGLLARGSIDFLSNRAKRQPSIPGVDGPDTSKKNG
jgi:hypothetical protein